MFIQWIELHVGICEFWPGKHYEFLSHFSKLLLNPTHNISLVLMHGVRLYSQELKYYWMLSSKWSSHLWNAETQKPEIRAKPQTCTALHSLHSTFSSALSFWQAFLNGNTLLKLNLKISMAVSLQNYDLGMFSVATMERELDTRRRSIGVLVPAQRLIGSNKMISEGHPGLTSYISEATGELLFPRSLRR